MSVPMTLSDRNPYFKVTVYIQVEYLKNGASYGQSYYYTLIGSHIPNISHGTMLVTLTDL